MNFKRLKTKGTFVKRTYNFHVALESGRSAFGRGNQSWVVFANKENFLLSAHFSQKALLLLNVFTKTTFHVDWEMLSCRQDLSDDNLKLRVVEQSVEVGLGKGWNLVGVVGIH
jgi:hypothetical protein